MPCAIRYDEPIVTTRLLLRPFAPGDAAALFRIVSDLETNRFLPYFPPATLCDAQQLLTDRYLPDPARPDRLAYAVDLKTTGETIGYVTLSDDAARDLGYCIRRDVWGCGYAPEAAQAVVLKLQASGVAFLTATHDRDNPRSGAVMQKIGMRYRYSYRERCQPKNVSVVFRMYQIDFTDNPVEFNGYRERFGTDFVETLPDRNGSARYGVDFVDTLSNRSD